MIGTRLHVSLLDVENDSIDLRDFALMKEVMVNWGDYHLQIGFDDYGERTAEPGRGTPVVIEFRNKIPYVLVFADINSEDPTHIISLAGAAEDKRKD